jgi:hypothetical protein
VYVLSCDTYHIGLNCQHFSAMYTGPKVAFQVERFVQFQEAVSGITV